MKRGLLPLLGALMFGVAPSFGQDYPARPVQVIVPFGGGSGSDVIARILFERIGSRLNQPFVIENRPAAGGNVGTALAAKAAPDGYTLLFNASGPLAINRTLYKDLPYNPERDFEPISLVAILPNIMIVSAKLGVATVPDFVVLAKHRSTPLNYSSPGNGTSTHIAGAYFARIAGINMTHVPYRSTTQLIGDLIAGEVPLSFLFLSGVAGPIQTGQAKALAVTSSQRLAALPNIPTMGEVGYAAAESAGWFAVLAPKGTPAPIVEKLHKQIAEAVADATVTERFSSLGALPKASTPAELQKFISSETLKWREVLESTGITAEQ